MLIDYIYLILILVLIGCIVFIIYLSYEYRINEGFNNKSLIPVTFDANVIKSQIDEQKESLSSQYKNFNVNAYSRQLLNINNDNQKIIDMTNKNNINSQKLVNLQNGISSDSNTFPIDKLIKTIKSKYNSQYLSTFSNDANNYGILVNDKCLTVNGLCKDEFCLLNCQNNLYTSDSQKFSSTRINSASEAAKAMNVDVGKISTNNIYPFNIFKSLINNNCLTISNNGLTVEKCNLNNIKQQWQISPNENICVLN